MEELLEKWAELEPDECIPMPKRSEIWSTGRLLAKIDIDEPARTIYYNDAIQGAVQQAIEEWGWDWSAATTHEPTYILWHASIKCNHDSNIWEPRQYSDKGSAEALLSAYLAALQATAEEVAG